jgi:hypothetical protein
MTRRGQLCNPPASPSPNPENARRSTCDRQPSTLRRGQPGWISGRPDRLGACAGTGGLSRPQDRPLRPTGRLPILCDPELGGFQVGRRLVHERVGDDLAPAMGQKPRPSSLPGARIPRSPPGPMAGASGMDRAGFDSPRTLVFALAPDGPAHGRAPSTGSKPRRASSDFAAGVSSRAMSLLARAASTRVIMRSTMVMICSSVSWWKTMMSSLRGSVIGREDAGYDVARRVHNGMIDLRRHAASRANSSTTLDFSVIRLPRPRAPLTSRGRSDWDAAGADLTLPQTRGTRDAAGDEVTNQEGPR